jgi:hypothetical protein
MYKAIDLGKKVDLYLCVFVRGCLCVPHGNLQTSWLTFRELVMDLTALDTTPNLMVFNF